MLAHSRDIRRRYPEAKTVFIGPCISKKYEADEFPGELDCVLTFDELTQWFGEENIEMEALPDSDGNSRTRVFPTSGGILKSMSTNTDGKLWKRRLRAR